MAAADAMGRALKTRAAGGRGDAGVGKGAASPRVLAWVGVSAAVLAAVAVIYTATDAGGAPGPDRQRRQVRTAAPSAPRAA